MAVGTFVKAAGVICLFVAGFGGTFGRLNFYALGWALIAVGVLFF